MSDISGRFNLPMFALSSIEPVVKEIFGSAKVGAWVFAGAVQTGRAMDREGMD